MKNVDTWSKYYNSKEPHNEELPSPWNNDLNDFQKMIVLRVIRPDKVSAIQCSRYERVTGIILKLRSSGRAVALSLAWSVAVLASAKC